MRDWAIWYDWLVLQTRSRDSSVFWVAYVACKLFVGFFTRKCSIHSLCFATMWLFPVGTLKNFGKKLLSKTSCKKILRRLDMKMLVFSCALMYFDGMCRLATAAGFVIMKYDNFRIRFIKSRKWKFGYCACTNIVSCNYFN